MGDFINASICEVCWNEKYPERKAPEKYGDHLVCHFCGGIHGSGIYIRQKSADRLQRDLATMTVRAETAERERDEARAMLAESKASLDRVGPIADECLQIAKTMAGSREEAAASERAAIVAMLERVARQYDDLHGNDEANALYAIAEEIIRLDHHREPGKETT